MATRNSNMRKNSFDFIIEFLTYIAGIIIVAVTFSVSWSAVVRYLGFRPPTWTFQFTEYALLWFTFLAAAWLLREGGHISIDTVVSRLPTKTRRYVDIMNDILGFIVSVIIFWFGTLHTIDLFQRGIMEVKGTTVPKFPLFLIIPLGGLALSIQFGRQFFSNIRSKSGDGEHHGEDHSKIPL
jgi:C4-dicarboxylate transporter DctQ subunit